jgi:hypothetical protein
LPWDYAEFFTVCGVHFVRSRQTAKQSKFADLSLGPSAAILDQSSVTIAAFSATPFERSMDDDVGTNLDTMKSNSLLVLLLDDRVPGECSIRKSRSQLSEEFALVAAFGLEETRLLDSFKGVYEHRQQLT